MANINDQTKQILNQNQNITQTTDKTLGNVQVENVFPVSDNALTIDDKMERVNQGYGDTNLLKESITADIMGTMFGDPHGGIKYPKGTDKDRTIETNRLNLLTLNELYEEKKYWDSEIKSVWNLDEDADMNVRDWVSKMFEKFQSKKEPKIKETELLKGSNYYPPQP